MTDPNPNQPQDGPGSYPPPPHQPPAGPGPYSPPESHETPAGADPYAPAPGEAPYGEPEPPKKSRTGKVVGIITLVVVVLLLACGGVLYYLLRSATSGTATNAKEGDCLAGDAITDARATTKPLKVVKCDSSDARYKVVAKIPDKSQSEAVSSLCEPYADKGAEIIYWQEKSIGAGVGNVLCLGNAKP